MEFSTKGKNISAFREIVQNDMISPERMKQVLKAAADKVVVSNADYHVVLDNGVRVNVTRRDKLPYTLLLKPQSGIHCLTVEVDLVPALWVPNTQLPWGVRNRLQCVQNKAGTRADRFLAIAMPVVSKDKLEVDFPMVSREMFKNRPSARMAVRLMKQERNEKGGSMEKVWSHAIKVAAIHEVLANPDPRHWHEARLELRFAELRSALGRYLSTGYMADPYFPEINMMDRIKNANLREEVATYLSRSAKSMEPGVVKDFDCSSGKCNKMFKSRDAEEQHARMAHGHGVSNLNCFPCPSSQCNRTFGSVLAANQHMRDRHSRSDPSPVSLLHTGGDKSSNSVSAGGDGVGAGGTSTAGRVALGVGIGVTVLGLGVAALSHAHAKKQAPRREEVERHERERKRHDRNNTH